MTKIKYETVGNETFPVELFEGCGKPATDLEFILVRTEGLSRPRGDIGRIDPSQDWKFDFTTCGHHYAAWQTLCRRCRAKVGLLW